MEHLGQKKIYICWGWSDRRNNRLDFPWPRFLPSPTLPGTSLKPWALQNTFWNPLHSPTIFQEGVVVKKTSSFLNPQQEICEWHCVLRKKALFRRYTGPRPRESHLRWSVLLSSHYHFGNSDELKQLPEEGPEFASHIPHLTLPVACISK